MERACFFSLLFKRKPRQSETVRTRFVYAAYLKFNSNTFPMKSKERCQNIPVFFLTWCQLRLEMCASAFISLLASAISIGNDPLQWCRKFDRGGQFSLPNLWNEEEKSSYFFVCFVMLSFNLIAIEIYVYKVWTKWTWACSEPSQISNDTVTWTKRIQHTKNNKRNERYHQTMTTKSLCVLFSFDTVCNNRTR